jgi:hypothetical protein
MVPEGSVAESVSAGEVALLCVAGAAMLPQAVNNKSAEETAIAAADFRKILCAD